MKEIILDSWEEFDERLRAEMGTKKLAVVRNFMRNGFDKKGNEIDLYARARKSGTDRGPTSDVWAAPGFDYEGPSIKKPNEIFYANRVDLSGVQTKVLIPDGQGSGDYEIADVTKGSDGGEKGALECESAVIVYDPRKVEHKTVNEYWFKGDPLYAALFLFRLKPCDDEEQSSG